MFLPIMVSIAAIGLFTIRNAKVFTLYLLTLFAIGGYFFVVELSRMFLGRL